MVVPLVTLGYAAVSRPSKNLINFLDKSPPDLLRPFFNGVTARRRTVSKLIYRVVSRRTEQIRSVRLASDVSGAHWHRVCSLRSSKNRITECPKALNPKVPMG
jgi:hypothetical protein